MFDIGFSELLVIGIVALIVVGPKDLPGMFHTLGRFTARARQLGREFSRAMDAAAKESGVNEVAKDLKNVTSPKSMGLNALKDAADKFESWKPGETKPAPKRGPETEKLAEERAEVRRKMNEAATAKAQAKAEAEAAAEAASWDEPPAAPKAKPATKKPAAKKAAAPKTAAAKPAAPRKRAAKKPAAAPDGDA